MCSICGSLELEDVYVANLRRTVTVKSTALENWLVLHEGGHTHDWKFIHCYRADGGIECGWAPANYDYRIFDAEFMQAATDDQVRGLVESLRGGQ
jgi:hypothetical protein